MKYDTPNQWYLIKSGKFEGRVVRPFNAEIETFNLKGKDVNDVSWSHGFTHCKDPNGDYVMFCGVNRFEELATECADPNDLNFNSDTEENTMNTLTDGDKETVEWTAGEALADKSGMFRIVYQTEDGAVFTSEQAAELYLGLTHILTALEDKDYLLAPAFEAFLNESIQPDE